MDKPKFVGKSSEQSKLVCTDCEVTYIAVTTGTIREFKDLYMLHKGLIRLLKK